MIEAQGLTLVGLALTNLEDDGAVQLALPFAPQLDWALDAALDEVRDRFGSAAVDQGGAARPRLAVSTMPLLPD